MERRFSNLSTAGRELSGYAVLWGVPSEIPGIGPELFKPDSLKASKAGVSLYFQHDKRNLLANTKAGTLKLEPDDKGLKYTALLPKSAEAITEACQRRDVQGVSVGFLCEKDDRREGKRAIEQAELIELSLVDKPAHKTSLKLRSKAPKRPHWSKLLWEF